MELLIIEYYQQKIKQFFTGIFAIFPGLTGFIFKIRSAQPLNAIIKAYNYLGMVFEPIPRSPLILKYIIMKCKVLFLVLIILSFNDTIDAQKQTKKYYISGQVTDVDSNPVPGAIIFIDYKESTFVTDNNGNYRVKVKPDQKNIAAFLKSAGRTEEIIDGRTTINFKLPGKAPIQLNQSNDESGDELINVGYGYTSKKNLTTSVSKIKTPGKSSGQYQNIYDMLTSNDPSIKVSGNSIQIQGAGSINSTEPLLIVDGIIVQTIAGISPTQVKSIEVLKGASAAIYGSRGANGVIMITMVGSER